MDLVNDKVICIKLLISNINSMYNTTDIDVREKDRQLKITVVDNSFKNKSFDAREQEFSQVTNKIPLHLWYDEVITLLTTPDELTDYFGKNPKDMN